MKIPMEAVTSTNTAARSKKLGKLCMSEIEVGEGAVLGLIVHVPKAAGTTIAKEMSGDAESVRQNP